MELWLSLGNLAATEDALHCIRYPRCLRCGLRVKTEERLVWAVGALAEGLGLRTVAWVFEVDANTLLLWLLEVSDHTAAVLGISCTRCASHRCNCMNSLPCSVR